MLSYAHHRKAANKMLKEVIQLNGRVPAIQGHVHFYFL